MDTHRPRVRLILRPDPDDIEWLHVQNRMGIEITIDDLPGHLRHLMHPLATALLALVRQDHKLDRFEFDTRTPGFAKVNGLPFDLRLLAEVENIEEVLYLVDWWIDYKQRRANSVPFHPELQPDKTWTCECGQPVIYTAEICSNAECPSWVTWVDCTNKRLPVADMTVRIAKLAKKLS